MDLLRPRRIDRVQLPPGAGVNLTDAEEEICSLFNDCTKRLEMEHNIHTECRIAGGWVRDKVWGGTYYHGTKAYRTKLLGSECNDIDIALKDMMGTTFAEHFAAYAESKRIKTGTISKIASNPDQSKHLETATFKFMGLDVDLVNLRSEEYADNSRIPTGVVWPSFL
jgi:tRNA nucleotidyltransferase (CCA-adding enzyme)